jgi:hypothetical protein
MEEKKKRRTHLFSVDVEWLIGEVENKTNVPLSDNL